MPRLANAGVQVRHLIAWGLPSSMLLLALIVLSGAEAGPAHWALWCVLSTIVSLSQPAVAQAFPAAWAGRALSAFNLVIFGGVFSLQWGIGLAIDGLTWRGRALRGRSGSGRRWRCSACACGMLSYVWFLLAHAANADNRLRLCT